MRRLHPGDAASHTLSPISPEGTPETPPPRSPRSTLPPGRPTVGWLRGLGAISLALLGASLLGVVLFQVDPDTAASLRTQARWGWIAGAIAGFAANHALRIVRWHVLLDAPISARRNAAICLVGFLAISTIPLRLGELVRPALLSREGVSIGRTLAALVMERLLDLCALLGLLGWVAVVPDLQPVLVDGTDVVGMSRHAAAFGIAIGALGLAAAAAIGDRLASLWMIGPPAAAMAAAVRDAAKQPARALLGAALTVAIWASILAYTRAGMAVLPALPQSMEATAVVWAAIMATITALPTPGFFGSFEAGAVGALQLYGIAADIAGVWALGLHAGYLAFVAALGLPTLMWLRRP